jgi:uncharacterized protein (TIGR00296 family)
MTFKLTREEGKFLVNLSRRTVTMYIESGIKLELSKDIPSKLMEPCGVFVTLSIMNNKNKMLRGCIGLPYPTTPLVEGVIDAAISAATQDPRFQPVTLEELNHIVFEVSVLTPPELVSVNKPTDYPSKIEVGSDGLIIEYGYNKGLLLPQVPVELNWNEEEFLCQTALKAGLTPDSWLMKDTRIYRFQAIIYEEVSPKGKIELKKI